MPLLKLEHTPQLSECVLLRVDDVISDVREATALWIFRDRKFTNTEEELMTATKELYEHLSKIGYIAGLGEAYFCKIYKGVVRNQLSRSRTYVQSSGKKAGFCESNCVSCAQNSV